jgi:hypothetical protein
MKTYYLTLSQVFPSTHPRAGEPTYFRENLRRSKLHTIRANYDFWRKRFEKIAIGEAVLSVREWVGKPYGKHSSMRELALLTREDGIAIQKLEFPFGTLNEVVIEDAKRVSLFSGIAETLARNDGLSPEDWGEWFKCYDLSKPMAIIHFTNFRY